MEVEITHHALHFGLRRGIILALIKLLGQIRNGGVDFTDIFMDSVYLSLSDVIVGQILLDFAASQVDFGGY